MADRVRMPLRDPGERGKDFMEVSLGYTAKEAREEAGRCCNAGTGLVWAVVRSASIYRALLAALRAGRMRKPITY